jgi:hypothetical protein
MGPKFALLAAAFLLVGAVSADAQSRRCRVMDPTGTPLNVRDEPAGRIVGRLPNGRLVRAAETVTDGNGRAWTFVHATDGEPIGWVFREFIACF